MVIDIESNKLGYLGKNQSLNEVVAESLEEIKTVAFDHMKVLTDHYDVEVSHLNALNHSNEDRAIIRRKLEAAFHKHKIELDAEIKTILGKLVVECEKESVPFGPFSASREMFFQFLLKTISGISAVAESAVTLPSAESEITPVLVYFNKKLQLSACFVRN